MAQLPPYKETDPAGLERKIASGEDGLASSDEIGSVHSGEDILGMQDMDPALNMKMHLVNNVSRRVLSHVIVGPDAVPHRGARGSQPATQRDKKKTRKANLGK